MAPQDYKDGRLLELIEGKKRWSRPLTEEEVRAGFKGWYQRGYLPHCDYPNLVQLITFRLGDSLPASRRGEWEHLLAIENAREKRIQLEAYLDRGHGTCPLRDPALAALAEAALLHHHGRRFRLLAWCVMPNHVHVLVEIWQVPMWKVVRSWKHYIQSQADQQRPLRWQREYWDTYMRDEAQERRAIHYVENNPLKARFCTLPERWPFSSARFRDAYRRLILPFSQVHPPQGLGCCQGETR